MEQLYANFNKRISLANTTFSRCLLTMIDWNDKIIAIDGIEMGTLQRISL
ncbi:MAG: hypothetical protein PF517_22005 [Salinivirgaceae bacterium]|jgi:hypothetical protein|nr:hypothetical protein [Salinivirgaceae bacterium]